MADISLFNCLVLTALSSHGQVTASGPFRVEVVGYEDGPDEAALVDVAELHSFAQPKVHAHYDSVFSSFLETQTWSKIGSTIQPMQKSICCDDEGCCGNKADPDAARFRLDQVDPGTASFDASAPPPGAAPFENAVPESPPDDTSFKESFLELDSAGRPIIVNKMCCGGNQKEAGGAGPQAEKVGGAGGDQFAAASVPSVPCVCTLVVNSAASAGGAGAAVAAGSAAPLDIAFRDEPRHSAAAPSMPTGVNLMHDTSSSGESPKQFVNPPPYNQSPGPYYEQMPNGQIKIVKPEYFNVGNGVRTLKDVHETTYRHAWTQGTVRPNPTFKLPIHPGNHFPWSNGAFKKTPDPIEQIIQANTDRSISDCRTINGVLEC